MTGNAAVVMQCVFIRGVVFMDEGGKKLMMALFR